MEGRTTTTDLERLTCWLTYFTSEYAADVASWVKSDQEMLWLAPGTAPPLSAAKVVGWGKDRHNRYLLWQRGHRRPIGYSELNPMPDESARWWIGHFVVDPSLRGQSLGALFARSLLNIAFDTLIATDVLLVVFPDNPAAISCYKRVGFVTKARERKYFDARGTNYTLVRMGIDLARFRKVAQGMTPHPIARLAGDVMDQARQATAVLTSGG